MKHKSNCLGKPLLGLLIFAVVLAVFDSAAAESNLKGRVISVVVDVSKPGAFVPVDFTGFSFEMTAIMAASDGKRYFSPTNLALVTMFQTLGIEHLRVGGNTADRDAKRMPSEADIDNLFAFARAAHVKVLYCLRLHHGDPAMAARTAKYIYDHYPDLIDCLAIGQEPSAYPVEAVDTRSGDERMGHENEKYPYHSYRNEWYEFARAILATVPQAKFAGPGVHNNVGWTKSFLSDFGRSNYLALVTAHLYPGGPGGKVPSPEIGRTQMLSGGFLSVYQKLYAGIEPAAGSNSLPFRLEEVNNYFNGGAKDVSDTFASALWGLESLHWWASRGAAGINFHTGDRVAAGSDLLPAKYTAIVSAPNGYVVRPLGYGIKAFDLGKHGAYVPVKLGLGASKYLSVYAVLDQSRRLMVTVINKSFGPNSAVANINLSAEGYSAEKMIMLQAPKDNVGAKSGITLGGSPIANDGSWRGEWKPLTSFEVEGRCFQIPASTAVIFMMRPDKLVSSK